MAACQPRDSRPIMLWGCHGGDRHSSLHNSSKAGTATLAFLPYPPSTIAADAWTIASGSFRHLISDGTNKSGSAEMPPSAETAEYRTIRSVFVNSRNNEGTATLACGPM